MNADQWILANLETQETAELIADLMKKRAAGQFPADDEPEVERLYV